MDSAKKSICYMSLKIHLRYLLKIKLCNWTMLRKLFKNSKN